jgi:predicted acylesterase/phospholipase RssA
MHLRFALRLVLLMPLLWLVACSGHRGPAVPQALEDRAEIPGLEGIRCWGHTMTPTLEAALVNSWNEELATANGDLQTLLANDAHYLALSGGGSDGAFGAGLLCGWTLKGTRPTFKIVTGISTGALIAPFAFAGPEYDGVLAELYTTISTKDISRFRGILGALTSDALSDTTPLRTILEKNIDDDFLDHIAAEYRKGRILLVGTTNMDAQKPVLWRLGALAATNHPQRRKLFIDVLVASAAIPGVFPPVLIDVVAEGTNYSELHSDGGTAAQVFLYPASFCISQFADEYGFSGRKRHAYVIRNSRLAPDWEEVRPRTITLAQRAVATLIKAQGVGDLYRIYLGCQRDGIEFNLASIPDDFLDKPSDTFDREYMKKLFQVGLRLGQTDDIWAHAPPGFEPPAPRTTPKPPPPGQAAVAPPDARPAPSR